MRQQSQSHVNNHAISINSHVISKLTCYIANNVSTKSKARCEANSWATLVGLVTANKTQKKKKLRAELADKLTDKLIEELAFRQDHNLSDQ